MKKLMNVVEIEGSGLDSLLGEEVLIMCSGYFYAGVLTGVNATCVSLEKPKIVYDRDGSKFTTKEDLPANEWFVATAAIESYGRFTK